MSSFGITGWPDTYTRDRYWDWTLDAVSESAVLKSPVFDPIFGFGGNGKYIEDLSGFPASWLGPAPIPGRQGGGCITSGPFAWRPVPMGPGNSTAFTPHCLRRDISPWLFTQAGSAARRDWVLEGDTFQEFDRRTQGVRLGVPDMASHAVGHLGVGGEIGEMTNMYSSPGDPLFFLHHAQIDMLWDKWQHNNWDVRKAEISGPDTMYAYPFNYFANLPYQNITLESELQYPLMAEGIKIADVMDTRAGPLCYRYE